MVQLLIRDMQANPKYYPFGYYTPLTELRYTPSVVRPSAVSGLWSRQVAATADGWAPPEAPGGGTYDRAGDSDTRSGG